MPISLAKSPTVLTKKYKAHRFRDTKKTLPFTFTKSCLNIKESV